MVQLLRAEGSAAVAVGNESQREGRSGGVGQQQSTEGQIHRRIHPRRRLSRSLGPRIWSADGREGGREGLLGK